MSRRLTLFGVNVISITEVMAFSLDNLITNVWSDFQNVKADSCIVKISIPIIWFGDMNTYFQNGNRRIVTIGLNPSKREFQDNKGLYRTNLRFAKASNIINNNTLSIKDVCDYEEAMNEYFLQNPYKAWFQYYEKILNLLNSSYYGSNTYNHAIHIDVCSPVATDPAWGGLCSNQKNRLVTDWEKYFSDFLNFLKPQIILISANQDIVNKIFTGVSWKFHIPSTSFYLKSVKQGKQIVIWGYNNRGNPFGTRKGISISQEIRRIRQIYNI